MFLKMFADKELPGVKVKVPAFDSNGVRSSKFWWFEIWYKLDIFATTPNKNTC